MLSTTKFYSICILCLPQALKGHNDVVFNTLIARWATMLIELFRSKDRIPTLSIIDVN